MVNPKNSIPVKSRQDVSQRCGYGLRTCRGVQFISSGMGSTDYCDNGKRVRVPDGAPLPERIFMFKLQRYGEFLIWHCENRRAGTILDRDPEPFVHIREIAKIGA